MLRRLARRHTLASARRAVPLVGRLHAHAAAVSTRAVAAVATSPTNACGARPHRALLSTTARACPATPTPSTADPAATAAADAAMDAQLPRSVHVIREHNCEYYLLGTVHSNVTSKGHITDVLELVKPDVVVVELDQQLVPGGAMSPVSSTPTASAAAGASAAALDADAAPINWDVFWWHLKRGELLFAFLAAFGRDTARRLSMTGLTEMLHAECEAHVRSIPVIRADRAFHITFSRLFRAVGTRARMHLLRNILYPPPQPDFAAVSYDDVLKALRERDGLLFPGLAQNVVFMSERDIAFVHALQSSVSDWHTDVEGRRKRVVGVFGAAHIAGIKKWWHKAQLVDYDQVMSETQPDKFNIDALWLQLYGDKYAVGCGTCKQLGIDYPNNTIVQHCDAPDANGMCSRDPRVNADAAAAAAAAAEAATADSTAAVDSDPNKPDKSKSDSKST